MASGGYIVASFEPSGGPNGASFHLILFILTTYLIKWNNS